MKILVVHNDYGKYSGEEAVVDKMVRMLEGEGHQVAQLRMTTAGLRESLSGKVQGFLAGIYSPAGVRAMREALRQHKPDVVNVHNLFPFISPAALRECKKAGIPVVMTVHNFRLICPTGLFMRNGGPCELCLERGDEWGCIRYNCEHSMLKSVGYAARNMVARWGRHYQLCVDRFACITDFQRQKLAEAGFDPTKLVLIPNSMDVRDEVTGDGKVADKDEVTIHKKIAGCEGITGSEAITGKENKECSDAGDYVAFAGRLSSEKGIDLIVEVARRNPEIPFRLAGDCREPELIENLPENVMLMGHLNQKELAEFYRNARFMVMASRWYEGFPMAILEGAQHAKATVGPDHGGFSEIIGKGDTAIGRLFRPGDVDALEVAVTELWNNAEESTRLGLEALQKLKREYSTQVIAAKWNALLDDLKSQCKH